MLSNTFIFGEDTDRHPERTGHPILALVPIILAYDGVMLFGECGLVPRRRATSPFDGRDYNQERPGRNHVDVVRIPVWPQVNDRACRESRHQD